MGVSLVRDLGVVVQVLRADQSLQGIDDDGRRPFTFGQDGQLAQEVRCVAEQEADGLGPGRAEFSEVALHLGPLVFEHEIPHGAGAGAIPEPGRAGRETEREVAGECALPGLRLAGQQVNTSRRRRRSALLRARNIREETRGEVRTHDKGSASVQDLV